MKKSVNHSVTKKNGLGENPSLYRLLVEEIRDYSIFMLDPQGNILTWNKGAREIKGYKKEDVLGKNFSLLYTKEDIENGKIQNMLKKAKKDGRYEENGIRVRKDGSLFWANVVITPLYDEDGKHVGFVNVSRDITEQRKNMNDLKNMKYALDQSSIVAITDRNGMIQYVNDKFVEISQYDRSELIGKTHRVINSKYHSPEYMASIWRTILSGNIWRGEIQNRAKDGTYYWVDTTITPLMDEYGKPKQFIAIRTDITKRKELEKQKDDFIGIASHELKTPLTSLKGYIQLIRKQCEKFQDVKTTLFITKIEKQIDKLNLLIQDLLDVTRIEAGKLSYQKNVFDMNSLVQEIIDTMQYTTDKHVIKKSGKATHEVYGDKDRIGQVLVNLLSNAIKYSPQANKIDLIITSSDEAVKICVRDYGVGISRENQDKIFDRFYRVNGIKENTYPGLGLGLYISSEIIKRHGGKIWFDSTPGEGSSFYFSIPAKA